MAEIFKSVGPEVWVYDCEYAPCLETARREYRLPNTMPDQEVLAEMYARNGATPENPKPMLKLHQNRLLSISAVKRKESKDGVTLTLRTMSVDQPGMTERQMIENFLQSVGTVRPQLVGFASRKFDLPVLFQRALIQDCVIPAFCRRPAKPWEGTDYFAQFSDDHIDLLLVLASNNWGKAMPSLDEIALSCGIPGKLGMCGADVAEAVMAGRIKEVAQYNELDALTQYLLWLKLARMSGWVSLDGYDRERRQLWDLLVKLVDAGKDHLQLFLDEWNKLSPLPETATRTATRVFLEEV